MGHADTHRHVSETRDLWRALFVRDGTIRETERGIFPKRYAFYGISREVAGKSDVWL
ncbi:hypothetical protein PSAC2689_100179 [Paraburkholderia sacchari]